MSVIDPKDKKGMKNQYIRFIKDLAVERHLPDQDSLIMDFGCGSGNLSKSFASQKHRILGIDISGQQLILAAQGNDPKFSKFVQFDGDTIPMKDQSIKYIISLGVLNYMVNDELMLGSLKELYRVLAERGEMIATAQTRRVDKYYKNEDKLMRPEEDFERLFEQAGFIVEKKEYLRRSRFPLLYLVQFGLIPVSGFKTVSKIDSFFAKCFHRPYFNYVDTLFILRKN